MRGRESKRRWRQQLNNNRKSGGNWFGSSSLVASLSFPPASCFSVRRVMLGQVLCNFVSARKLCPKMLPLSLVGSVDVSMDLCYHRWLCSATTFVIIYKN